MSLRFGRLLGLGLAIGLLAACTKPSPHSSSRTETFAERISRDWVGVILRLETPPFGAQALWRGHRLVVAPRHIQALLDEQARVERRLREISPEIRILFRYRNVYNGIAIVAPRSTIAAIEKIPGVLKVRPDVRIEPPSPDVRAASRAALAEHLEREPARFIGAHEAYALGFKGQGMRVGIIDTGVDYTHAMLGGPGTSEAYRAIDPTKASPAVFPNAKVVGGFDFAGTNPWEDPAKPPLPKPDPNPLDESGHGTHVAGIVAGRGNGTNTFDGVAPEAVLYAIKVFGKKGGTPGSSLLAGLDYTLDPNGDMDLNDRLDVVNISLGSGFGSIFDDDYEIFNNARNTNVIFVAAAGNDGPIPFIVGNPSASTESLLSVAASIDAQEVHWRFPNSRFTLPSGELLDVRSYPAQFAKPLAQSEENGGPLVYVGNAATELTEEQRAALAGKVALIDRGENTFIEKARRVLAAGATGFVVANNRPGEAPFVMGGAEEGAEPLPIPGIMISYETGEIIKSSLTQGAVLVDFTAPTFTETPEVIDTIAGFSSRGPRSFDALIKPEISAPGHRIISAEAGSGTRGVAFSGTSMASPMVAGAMALLRQAFPTESVETLRARVMNTAKILKTREGTREAVAMQGAGRIQIGRAIDATLLTWPQTVSLGLVRSGGSLVQRNLTLANLTKSDKVFDVSADLSGGGLIFEGPATVRVPAMGQAHVTLRFRVDGETERMAASEWDGFVKFAPRGTDPEATVPVLVLAQRGSQIGVSPDVKDPGLLWLQNRSRTQSGDALLFHLLGTSPRLPTPAFPNRGNPCDLRTVGYRVIEREVAATEEAPATKKPVLQFAVQIDTPLTNAEHCEFSARFDFDGDKTAEFELIGGLLGDYTLREEHLETWASILFDFKKMRELARKYFDQRIAEPNRPVEATYEEAIRGLESFTIYRSSTLQIVEADLATLRAAGTRPRLKVAMQPVRPQFADDDFLGAGRDGEWIPFNLENLEVSPFPEVLELGGLASQELFDVPLRSVLFFPHNPLGSQTFFPDEGKPALRLADISR